MNVSFRAGESSVKSRHKSLEQAFGTGRRPVFVICGQKAHRLPASLILHWSDGVMSCSALYVDGVKQSKVAKEAWWSNPVLSVQPGYAEFRSKSKKIQWKEGRIK